MASAWAFQKTAYVWDENKDSFLELCSFLTDVLQLSVKRQNVPKQFKRGALVIYIILGK